MNDLSKAQGWALEYAKLGWPVFPVHSIVDGACSCGQASCKAPGKHPATGNGHNDASNDAHAVKRMFAHGVSRNIGIATGPGSGLFVVDLDGEEGVNDFRKLEAEHGPVPRTVTAKTGGGGLHNYLRYPADREVRNRTKIDKLRIDCRGDGGYVVAPPSKHVSGNDYQWIHSPLDTEVAEAPDWALDLVTGKRGPSSPIDPLADLVDCALDLATHPGVPEGQRHDTACRLIGAHLGRSESPLGVLDKAKAWGATCEPPMDEAEIEQIVRDLDEKERQATREAIDDPHRLAHLIVDTRFQHDDAPRLRFWNSTWHHWREGPWRKLAKEELRAIICQVAKAEFDRAGPTKRTGFVRKVNTALLNNVFVALESLVLIPGDMEQPCWLSETGPWPSDEVLVAKNGLIHLPSFVDRADYLLPHTPSFFTPAALDYEIKPTNESPTQWLTFLEQLWPDDPESIRTLQQWFGYLLLPDTRQQKILLVVGPKRSGKGTISRILEKMVGRHSFVGPTLSSLGQNFGLWPLLGKSVAVVSDARLDKRVSPVILERLLSVSGEDLVTFDQKHLPAVTTKLPTRIVILTNELPVFRDSSTALGSIPRQNLYQAYCFFCQQKGRRHVESDSTFGRELRAAVPTIVDRHLRDGAARVRYYDGISLLPEFKNKLPNDSFFQG